MEELIEFVAKSLVDDVEAVNTHVYNRGDQTVVELEVAQADLGKVIGRQGRIARALRAIVRASGARSHRRVVLEILE